MIIEVDNEKNIKNTIGQRIKTSPDTGFLIKFSCEVSI